MKQGDGNQDESLASEQRMDGAMGRRSFLLGTLGVGALTAAGALVGCAPQASSSAQSESNGDDPKKAAYEAATEPIAPVDPPASYDYDVDVVVVGSGAGGVAASLRLADAGMSVALLDKDPQIGGASRYAMYIINVGGHQIAEKYQYAMPSYPYNVDNLVQWLHGSEDRQTSNSDLLRAIYTSGPKTIDWLIDEYGCKLEAMNRSAEGCVQLYWEQDIDGEDPFEKLGWGDWFDSIQNEVIPTKSIDLHLNTTVTALVSDGGEVVGVKATQDQGDVFFHAKKGVILAAGDFSANRALFKKYCPYTSKGITTLNGYDGDTGDAFRMGLGMGADVAGFDTVGMTDCDIVWRKYEEYDLDMECHISSSGQTVAAQPWMRVNKFGERVAFNDANCAGIMPANPETFVCFDSKWGDLIEENHFQTRGPRYATTRKEQFQKIIDSGIVSQADTIEELEVKLGLAEGTLSQNVEKWNAACEAGEDWVADDKYDPQYLVPIDTPPYFGVGIGGMLWGIKCGLKVTPQLEVLSTEGTVVPGLYASFHTAGGQCGDMNTSQFSVSGFGQLGMSFVGGYMAADSIIAKG